MYFVKYIQGKKDVLITILICFSIFSPLGYYCARKDIVVYEWNGHLVVYPSNRPTYNLPLPEFSYLLDCLNNGDIEKAKKRLESLLDSTRGAAEYRLSVATPAQRKIIRNALEICQKKLISAKQKSVR